MIQVRIDHENIYTITDPFPFYKFRILRNGWYDYQYLSNYDIKLFNPKLSAAGYIKRRLWRYLNMVNYDKEPKHFYHKFLETKLLENNKQQFFNTYKYI